MKEDIIRADFEVVRRYVGPGAVLSTLGGWGEELRLWREYGVPSNQIIAIEHHRARASQLTQDFPEVRVFRSDLKNITESWGMALGTLAPDYFHWDLCGTVEPNMAAIAQFLQIFLRGKGKLLAVTMADARRNRAQERPDDIIAIATEAFGNAWDDLNAELVRRFDAERSLLGIHVNSKQCVVRLLGALIHLVLGFSALESRSRDVWTVNLKRLPSPTFLDFQNGAKRARQLISKGTTLVVPNGHVETTYWTKADFRMRHILMSLGVLPEPIPLRTAFARVAETILASQHRVCTSGTPVEISTQTQGITTAMGTAQPHDTLLKELAQWLPPHPEARKILASLTELLAASGPPPIDVSPEMTALDTAIANMRSKLNGSANTSLIQNGVTTPPVTAQDTTPEHRARREKPKFDTLPLPERDLLRVRVMRAFVAEGEVGKEKAFEAISRETGLQRLRNKGRKLGGFMARGSGAFRPDFVARLMQGMPRAEREEIASKVLVPYYQFELPEFTAKLLFEEAKKSSHWQTAAHS